MGMLGGEAKAMIVTGSREHALRYYFGVRDYIKAQGYTDMKALVAFSGTVHDPKDGLDFTETQMNGFAESQTAEKFKLDDNRILIVGGWGNNTHPEIFDPTTMMFAPTSGNTATRAWHTATVLPDGTVLILGGIGSDGRVVDQSEVFDPRSQKFQLLSSSAPIPRAFHSATLLTDGRVVVAVGKCVP